MEKICVAALAVTDKAGSIVTHVKEGIFFLPAADFTIDDIGDSLIAESLPVCMGILKSLGIKPEKPTSLRLHATRPLEGHVVYEIVVSNIYDLVARLVKEKKGEFSVIHLEQDISECSPALSFLLASIRENKRILQHA